jgi:hypothetical protein
LNSTRSKSVPKAAQAVYDSVVAPTDAFCRDHLNDEYRDLAQAMTAALCRKRPKPLTSGPGPAGSSNAFGQLNFLSDEASQPYMTMAEVCAGFGVSQSTAFAKARVITDALHTGRINPAWMLRSLVDRSPTGVDGRGQWPAGRPARHAAGGSGDRVREGHDPVYPGGPGVDGTVLPIFTPACVLAARAAGRFRRVRIRRSASQPRGQSQDRLSSERPDSTQKGHSVRTHCSPKADTRATGPSQQHVFLGAASFASWYPHTARYNGVMRVTA